MKSIITILVASIFLLSCNKDEAPATSPTVLSLDPSEISLTSFIMSGEVTNEGFNAAKDRGFVYSATNPNPSVSDNKISVGYGKGQYSHTLDKLSINTTYYYKAYATNDKGTAYGEVKTVKTADYLLALVSTNLPQNITYTTAELGGNVIFEGGIPVTEKGLCLAIGKTPTIEDIKIVNGKGLGVFSNIVIQLMAGSNYIVRAYAINGKGVSYGNEQKFSTAALKTPTVSTGPIQNINATYATFNGNVTDNGGDVLIEKGFCLSKSPNPSISDIKLRASNNDIGNYAMVITSLDPASKYYVKAYAQNSKGVSYGSETSFSTNQATLPIVGTNDFQEITLNSVRAGVEIASNGGADITEFGVCLSTNRNPSIYDRKVILGTTNSPGKMDNIYGLSSNTTYYLRGYAINRIGVAYGPERSFATGSPVQNNLKSGLAAFFPFNGNANDASGNQHNGINFGGTLTSDRFGQNNSSMFFNGNSYILAPLSNSSQNLALSVWFLSSNTINFPIYSVVAHSSPEFSLIGFVNDANIVSDNLGAWQFQDYNILMFNYFPFHIEVKTAQINSSKWHHIVFQRTNNLVQIYYDGILQGSQTGVIGVQSLTDLVIGKQWKTLQGLFFTGKIDDIGVWNRTLSQDEINYLFQNSFQP